MAEPVPVAEIPRAILEDMWVVHAAHRLPKDGILIPGSCFTEKKGSQPKGQPITGLAGWKATLHFALAGVAPDGEDHQFSGLYGAGERDCPWKDFNPSLLAPADELAAAGAWTKTMKTMTFTSSDLIVKSVATKIASLNKDSAYKFEWRDVDTADSIESQLHYQASASEEWKLVDKTTFAPVLKNAKKPIEWISHHHHTIGVIQENKIFLIYMKTPDNLKINLKDGCAELREYVETFAKDMIATRSDFEPYWKDLQLRCRDVIKKMQPAQVLKVFFVEDGNISVVASHIITWLIKARFLKTKAVKGVQLRGYGSISDADARANLVDWGLLDA